MRTHQTEHRSSRIPMKARALPIAAFVFLLGALGLSGCQEEGPAERAGEQIDDAMDEVMHEVDEAMDEVDEAMDDVSDSAAELADETEDEIDDAAEAVDQQLNQ